MNWNVYVVGISGHQEQMSYLPYALILNARVLTGTSQDRMERKRVRRMVSNIFLYFDNQIRNADRLRYTKRLCFLGVARLLLACIPLGDIYERGYNEKC
jgi:hypothetical protein